MMKKIHYLMGKSQFLYLQKKNIKALKNIIINKIPNNKQKQIPAYVRKSVNECPSDIILRGKEMVNLSNLYKFNLMFNGKI